MSTQADIAVTREEAAHAGEQIYEGRLKSLLEPHHKGRVVAIHIPSEDHFLGDSLLDATDLLRDKYPLAGRGDVYARRVGEPMFVRARAQRVLTVDVNRKSKIGYF